MALVVQAQSYPRFGLMSLPVEVRLEIYKNILRKDLYQGRPEKEMLDNWMARPPQIIGSTNILLTSRKVYEEAQDILDDIPYVFEHREGGFYFYRHSCMDPEKFYWKTGEKCSPIPREALTRLRNVTVAFSAVSSLNSVKLRSNFSQRHRDVCVSSVIRAIRSEFDSSTRLRSLNILCDGWASWTQRNSFDGRKRIHDDIKILELKLMQLAYFKPDLVDMRLCSRHHDPTTPCLGYHERQVAWRSDLQSIHLQILGWNDIKATDGFVDEDIVSSSPYSDLTGHTESEGGSSEVNELELSGLARVQLGESECEATGSEGADLERQWSFNSSFSYDDYRL